MPSNRQIEIEQLHATVAELQELLRGNGRQVDNFKLPDPIKNMSDFTGNKKELAAWLEELDELYEMYLVKGENDAPDTIPSHYMRAIKNKIKGEARTILCANGNPSSVPGIRRVLLENYGDQRDLATNLSQLFHMKRGDRNNHKFYADVKELSSKLKMNLTLNPVETNHLIEILIITKYLDNIGEPLASIIRQSKPESLEEAYQAVCINQNAEARNRPAYQNKSHLRQNSSNEGSSKFPPKPPFKKNFTQHKPSYKTKAEVHNNEIEEEREEDEPDALNYSDDDDDDNDGHGEVDESNFQNVRLIKQLT